MAEFRIANIDPDSPGQTVWRQIRDLLATSAQSVEIVLISPASDPTVEIRTWSDVRRDGSNDANAPRGGSW